MLLAGQTWCRACVFRALCAMCLMSCVCELVALMNAYGLKGLVCAAPE